MKLSDRDRQILQHIVNYCDEVSAAVELFGREKSGFNENVVYRNAVSMPILQIGELANHLSEDFIQKYSQIPWRAIVGMRNRFAHGYQVMDVEEIWQTATEDLSELKDFCRKVLLEG